MVERLVGEYVFSVRCGWRHTVALTSQKELYVWGHGRYGQLGHGGMIDVFLPLSLGSHRKCTQVACGWRHTAALARDGTAFSWGDGQHMQLGHGDNEMQLMPKVVQKLARTTLVQVECGMHHCTAVSTLGQVKHCCLLVHQLRFSCPSTNPLLSCSTAHLAARLLNCSAAQLLGCSAAPTRRSARLHTLS